jgi:hypothetical protein
MPQILATTDGTEARESVLLRERVSLSDFESDHFASMLIERVGWAVLDADELEDATVDQAEGPEYRRL